ncbi:hypothetical protein F5X98DRAFT_289796 [Xylaria grammica]|nr:hypothetical protein F5X98DRAFT_289796 [Xylaria grammica]
MICDVAGFWLVAMAMLMLTVSVCLSVYVLVSVRQPAMAVVWNFRSLLLVIVDVSYSGRDGLIVSPLQYLPSSRLGSHLVTFRRKW